MSKKLIVITLIFVMAFLGGCDMINNTGIEDVTTGEEPQYEVDIPESDDELHNHVSGEMILGLENLEDKDEVLEQIEGEVLEILEPLAAVRVKLEEDQAIVDAMEAVSSKEEVVYLQPNYTYELIEPVEQETPGIEDPREDQKDTIQPASADAPAFDTIQYGPQQINAPAAWDQNITGDGVVISVIDTGVDADHQDLEGRVLEGWNTEDWNDNTDDWYGHGTHVAGIAAAAGDNGKGMAGTAWDAEILPIRTGFTSVAISVSIIISANPGEYEDTEHLKPADIINMSLGGPAYSPLIQDAINYARKEDVLVISSMGNSYKEHKMYPAANEGVLAVGATDPNDEKTDFSTMGNHISVSAPGELVYSSLPNDGYARWSGTSMSSPFVAGAAALILSEKNMTPSEVQKLLEETADSAGSFNKKIGHGRINVAEALDKGTPETLYGEILVELELIGVDMKEAELTLYREDKVVGNSSIVDENEKVYFFDLLSTYDYDLTVSLVTTDDDNIIEKKSSITVDAGETTEITVEIQD